MSEYLPFCAHNPCPICGDISGKCEISEYGHSLACSTLHLPEAKEGDLQGFWKCFRSKEEYSQWEDQRVRLRNTLNPKQFKLTIFGADSLEELLDGALKRHIKRHEGEGGER
jgi:hypothetical protein